MVFSSLTFVYAFLPLTAVLYFIIPNRSWRNGILLLASLVFYSWGEPKFLLLLLAAALVAWLGGIGIDAAARRGRETRKKTIYIVSLCLLAGNLFVFKYLNFAADSLGKLLGQQWSIAAVALPIGISFYTFQILSYLIDLYRGNVAVQKNYFLLLLYVSFFPQLIAGPIVRYQTVETEIRERKETTADVSAGLRRFIIGLAKKVLLSNGLAELPELIYVGRPAVFGSTMYWIAAIAFSLQIYFDFSGYSDMAIGLGRLFGFTFPENFDFPYISRSLSEFWRRWHMTLNRWFVQYLYIPLGGRGKGKGRTVFNKLLVFLATGLWHGAGWTYILWGLWHGVFVSAEGLCRDILTRLEKSFFGRALLHIYTLLVVALGFAMFRAADVREGFAMLGALFSFAPCRLVNPGILNGARIAALLAGLVFCFPIEKQLENAAEKCGALWHIFNLLTLIGLAVSILALSAGGFTPFIYQQF